MTQNELKTLAEKHRLGTATKAEEQLLHQFVDTLQQQPKKQFKPSAQNRLRIVKGIEAKIATTTKPALNYKKILAYAAVFVGIISMAAFSTSLFKSQWVTKQTGKGEKRSLTLADGSVIILNANSSVEYAKDFTSSRQVHLTGEAYFEVQRDTAHPFTITTGAIQTQVLGTTFNINAYQTDEVSVSVNSGKVAVENRQTKQTVVLKKDQQVLFKGAAAPVATAANSEDQRAWTRNIIALNNTSLAKTAGILENWYDVEIDFEDATIEELKITGKFKEEPLETVLQSIALINNLKIDTLTQKHFVIRKNNTTP
ncbi:MAG: FecR domain-containing protein [Bacteroidota bacterium]|nr:FecR domain-containing protein [Bacteroidota bacterium]MEE3244018.1 FecR domain-containing protein [Bacteroidota bacterium]